MKKAFLFLAFLFLAGCLGLLAHATVTSVTDFMEYAKLAGYAFVGTYLIGAVYPAY